MSKVKISSTVEESEIQRFRTLYEENQSAQDGGRGLTSWADIVREALEIASSTLARENALRRR